MIKSNDRIQRQLKFIKIIQKTDYTEYLQQHFRCVCLTERQVRQRFNKSTEGVNANVCSAYSVASPVASVEILFSVWRVSLVTLACRWPNKTISCQLQIYLHWPDISLSLKMMYASRKSLLVMCDHIAVDPSGKQNGHMRTEEKKNILKVSNKLASPLVLVLHLMVANCNCTMNRFEWPVVGRRKQWVKTAVHGREAISSGLWPTDSSVG